jgi:hypothetical protein
MHLDLSRPVSLYQPPSDLGGRLVTHYHDALALVARLPDGTLTMCQQVAEWMAWHGLALASPPRLVGEMVDDVAMSIVRLDFASCEDLIAFAEIWL